MVIETFHDTWKHIVAALQEAASTTEWGIDPEQITPGNFQADTVIAPPAIVVYLTPGKMMDTQNIYSQVATLSVFPIVEACGETVDKGISTAVALGWKVVEVLQRVGLTMRWGREKVTLDTVQDGWAASLIRCEVWYKEI